MGTPNVGTGINTAPQGVDTSRRLFLTGAAAAAVATALSACGGGADAAPEAPEQDIPGTASVKISGGNTWIENGSLFTVNGALIDLQLSANDGNSIKSYQLFVQKNQSNPISISSGTAVPSIIQYTTSGVVGDKISFQLQIIDSLGNITTSNPSQIELK